VRNDQSDRAAVEQSAAALIVRSDEFSNIELTPEILAELLDPEGWAAILRTYARTMRTAVGLADPNGHLLGECFNPQRVWLSVREASREEAAGCSFCLPHSLQCSAAAEALRINRATLARDQAGLAHVAVPLSLRGRPIGVLLAGQVFDRYPEPLPLQRVARGSGVSAQELWHQATEQAPISRNTLQLYGDLLTALGQAFLRERLAAILDRKLAEVNHRYRLLIDSVKDYAFFTVDMTGHVVDWNKGAETLLGYTAADIVGRDYSCLFPQEDIDSGAPEEELRAASRDGQAEREGWRVRQNGSRFFGASGLTLLKEGEVHNFVKVVHDITERRIAEENLIKAQKLESIAILERRVTERTLELSHSNEDLERANQDLLQFAYSASHDLQEPLRTVSIYSQLFKRMYEGKIDSTADEFLGYMVDGARRMQMLVRDLLTYTQSTAHSAPASPVDANMILSETLNSLEVLIRETNAVITASELPTIEMHAVHLRQLFLNFIGNALKYRSTESAPAIHVSAERYENEWMFSIRDNGIGIEPRYATLIFGIFKRLHTADKYSGTGIGLAICQKIVESYRGRIWVESAVQRGSTFCFTLPA
jgi:PAS domain S-box-containing protein